MLTNSKGSWAVTGGFVLLNVQHRSLAQQRAWFLSVISKNGFTPDTMLFPPQFCHEITRSVYLFP